MWLRLNLLTNDIVLIFLWSVELTELFDGQIASTKSILSIPGVLSDMYGIGPALPPAPQPLIAI